jgi:ferritin-like protein
MDLYMADISVGYGIYGQILSSHCPDVQSHMKMIFPQLPEIGGKLQGDIQGLPEISIAGCMPYQKNQQQHYQQE